MEIKWYGTAAVEYSTSRGRILTDPFIPLTGSEHRVDVSEYDGYADILVTHGHFDHIVNIPEIIARNPGATVHCTETPYRTLVSKGVPERNLHLLLYGDSLQLQGFEITVYHGRHAVLPKATFRNVKRLLTTGNLRNVPYAAAENRRCPENGETVAYLISDGRRTVFHMGSMNLREDTEYPAGCDVLMLPYNGWEDNFPPAVSVIRSLNPKRVYLHHFDNTFPPLTEEPKLTPLLEEFGELIYVPEYRTAVSVEEL